MWQQQGFLVFIHMKACATENKQNLSILSKTFFYRLGLWFEPNSENTDFFSGCRFKGWLKLPGNLITWITLAGAVAKWRFSYRERFKKLIAFLCTHLRAVGTWGAGGACAPTVFGRSVDPISTRGACYAHYITTCPLPLDFQTFWQNCHLVS